MAQQEENKPFEEMSFEEISAMSKEAFMHQMNQQRSRYLDALTNVGDPHYESYTREQKIKFWESVLNRQMRWQVEGGLDAYAIFSPGWYKAMKRIEPHFDEIIEEVFNKPGFSEWDKDEYKKCIEE